jgi:hypothetical protein
MLNDCSQNSDITILSFISTNYQNNSYYPNCAQHSINKCLNLNDLNSCQDLFSPFLKCPLNISFNQQKAYIVNAISYIPSQYSVLRCDPLLKNCNIITQNLPMPIDVIDLAN